MRINDILGMSVGIAGGLLIYKIISYIPVILLSTLYAIVNYTSLN